MTNQDREKFEAWWATMEHDYPAYPKVNRNIASNVWQAALQSQQADCGCADQRDCTGECCKQAAAEPVAWMDADGNISDNNHYKSFNIPLFTTPPATQSAEMKAALSAALEVIDGYAGDPPREAYAKLQGLLKQIGWTA